MSMINPLAKSRTPILDITPGSEIEVRDTENSIEPFRATVVEMKPEYGPNSIPALIALPEGAADPVLLMDSGKWIITVLVNAANLQGNQPPANLLTVRNRPAISTALQFNGGLDSALAIIKWCGGKALVSHHADTDQRGEHLILHATQGDQTVEIGDYVMQSDLGVVTMATPDWFAGNVEIVPVGSLGTGYASLAQQLGGLPTLPGPGEL